MQEQLHAASQMLEVSRAQEAEAQQQIRQLLLELALSKAGGGDTADGQVCSPTATSLPPSQDTMHMRSEHSRWTNAHDIPMKIKCCAGPLLRNVPCDWSFFLARLRPSASSLSHLCK